MWKRRHRPLLNTEVSDDLERELAAAATKHQPLICSGRGMSMSDLAELGVGKIAYVVVMTYDAATKLFPEVEGIPSDVELFALYGANGAPLALTNAREACVNHAVGDDLEIAPVH